MMILVCFLVPLVCVSSLTCWNGMEAIGSRERFWNFNNSTGRPILVDLLSTHGQVHAVFNTREGVCHNCPKGNWEDLRWWCKFDVGTGEAFPIVNDPHGHTLIVSCNLTLSDFARTMPNNPVSMSITAISKTTNLTTSFENLEFCRYPNDRGIVKTQKFHLGACTSVTGAHLFRVPEWIIYHLQQGWEHFYIYANEDPSAARSLLDPFIKRGVVEVVDFQWPRSSHDFLQQMAAENSCLIRYRGLARWVSMTDVDEFFLPLLPMTVAAFLHKQSESHNISSFRFLPYLFGSQDTNAPYVSLNSTKNTDLITSSLCISQFLFRGAQPDKTHVKTIVQPLCMTYFAVHDVTLGAPAKECFGELDIRVAHYKTPRTLMHKVLDSSLCRHASAVLQELNLFGFVNYTVPETAWSAFWNPRP